MREQYPKRSLVRVESVLVGVLADRTIALRGSVDTDTPALDGFVLLRLPPGVYRVSVQQVRGGQPIPESVDLEIS